MLEARIPSRPRQGGGHHERMAQQEDGMTTQDAVRDILYRSTTSLTALEIDHEG
jgi:hypothetical protein